MEHLYLYISLLSILLTLLIMSKKHRNFPPLPPGNFGLPFLGETLQFIFTKPEQFVLERMEKFNSEIFKTKILGENTAVICGPNGHRFLFTNEQRLFTAFRPHSMQKLFRSYHTKPEDSKILKSPGFLKPEALIKYLQKMDLITQIQIQKNWAGNQTLKVFPQTKTLTLTLACRFFLGIEDPDRIASLVHHFDEITAGLHSIPINFPGTVFYRANRAAGEIRKVLRGVIDEKKCAMEGGMVMNDILSHMIVATDPAGKIMAEDEIADKTMGLLIAGYSTVATAMTFFMKYVAERPDVYEKIRQEHVKISEAKGPGELLEWEDMQKMKYSWNVTNEVMRLTPPLQGTFRETLVEFIYAGYTIPKGWKVYWTVSTTNKNPKYFPNPENFDPLRYDEGKVNFPAFTFVPFGGGPRMCPGREYARLAILTFVHNIVMKFKWELVCPNEKIEGDMMPTPQKGLPIYITSH